MLRPRWILSVTIQKRAVHRRCDLGNFSFLLRHLCPGSSSVMITLVEAAKASLIKNL